MSHPIDRRHFLGAAAAAGLAARLSPPSEAAEAVTGADGPAVGPGVTARPTKPFLTEAGDFVDVSRGNPNPHTLRGEARARARLTPETWRLEVVGDGSSELARPCRVDDGSALDLAGLRELGKAHGVVYLKAMQCNN